MFKAPVIRLALAIAFCAGASWYGGHLHAEAQSTVAEPFDPSTMDKTVDACTNFFGYATGGWLKTHPIPADRAGYGYIEQLEENNQQLIRSTIEAAQQSPGAPGSATQKVGSLYGSCMNTAAIERAGLGPIKAELTRIDAIASPAELPPELAHLQSISVDAGFSVNATQDNKNSALTIAELDQGGIGLPERDYYTRTDAASRKLRGQYLVHVQKMLALAGDATSAADAKAILAFETQLASASLPEAALRDPDASYHPMSEARAAALAPAVPIPAFLRRSGIPAQAFINVAEPAYVTFVGRAVHAVPLTTWKAYLRWRLLDAFAPALPAKFDDEHFAFTGKILSGQLVQQARWKRCVGAANRLLGEAVGRAYVARVFSPADKQRATALAELIRSSYKDEISGLEWMTPPTKRIAIQKLNALNLQVGYPNKWRTYATYAVDNGSYAGNVLRGVASENAFERAKIGKPVDRTFWGMTPQTVNAYNDTQRNEVVITAAQLQRPFFDAASPDSDNLGATGAGTIGHEMTHGFDDEGHKFDLYGNVRNWWTPTDLAAFTKRADCVIDQFDHTVAVDDIHYQGKLEAGEAIADLGGTVLGYRALENALGTGPHDPVDGFTPEQRYFLAFAQSWTEESRHEADVKEARTDPHPIPRDRVNMTVHNVPEWYAAFNCPKPPTICQVW